MRIVLTSRSGPDGKLHLEIPVNQPDAEFEVTVEVRPKAAKPALPSGYFSLIGSIDDETFTVHPPPPLPPPVEFE